MLSYIILFALALGINAAPASRDRHMHQDIHLKRLHRHKHHGHAPPDGSIYSKRGGPSPQVVYTASARAESQPEWLRRRF